MNVLKRGKREYHKGLPNKKARTAIEGAVKRGAKLLDKNYPGWAREVKLSDLEFDCSCNCVYGQLDSAYEGKCKTVPGTFIEDQDVQHGTDWYGYIVPDSAYNAAGIPDHYNNSSWFDDTARQKKEDLWAYQENCWRDEIRARARSGGRQA